MFVYVKTLKEWDLIELNGLAYDRIRKAINCFIVSKFITQLKEGVYIFVDEKGFHYCLIWY